LRYDAIWRRSMIDRQQLEAVLMHRFPGAPMAQIAAAANAIMALSRSAPREGLLRQPGVGPATDKDYESIDPPPSLSSMPT
jgi:hypothetical protein